MENKTHKKVKPLEIGRQMFSWICTDAIEVPLNKYQTLARQIFRFVFVIMVITSTVATNSSLFINHITLNDIDELIFGFYQLITTLYGASASIAIFIWGAKLASLFRNLDNIYYACNSLISCV